MSFMKKLLAVALLSTTMLAGAASAEGDFFVQGNLGASTTKGLNSKLSLDRTVAGKTNSYTKSDNLGTSALIGLEAGAKVHEHVRVSINLDYRPGYSQKYTTNFGDIKAKVKTLSSMFNVYYDITEVNGFTPYITVGAGIARNEMKMENTNSSGYKKKNTGFAYKVGFGTKYAMSQDFDLDLRYQYVDLGKAKFEGTEKDIKITNTKAYKLRAHELLVGVAYKF